MSFLIVDERKCTKDGFCAAECPMALIVFEEEAGYPSIIPGNETVCNRCGHCIAACPHGALSHSHVPAEDCPEIKPELVIAEEQIIQLYRSRRSIRLYEDKPVEKAKIERLIEVASYAPTGGNNQLLEWLVLTDRSTIHEIARLTVEFFRQDIREHPRMVALSPYLSLIIKIWETGRDSILWNAPVLLVASAPECAPTGMVDLSIALSHLDLFAPVMGLGTCWAGLLQHAIASSPSLKEFVGVPTGHPHHFPMILGYPKATYYRLPRRKPPRVTFP